MDMIRTIRQQRNLSQKDLAEQMGVTPAAISHWETGRRIPDANDLIAIAKVLNCKVDDLIDK